VNWTWCAVLAAATPERIQVIGGQTIAGLLDLRAVPAGDALAIGFRLAPSRVTATVAGHRTSLLVDDVRVITILCTGPPDKIGERKPSMKRLIAPILGVAIAALLMYILVHLNVVPPAGH